MADNTFFSACGMCRIDRPLLTTVRMSRMIQFKDVCSEIGFMNFNATLSDIFYSCVEQQQLI